MEAGSPTYGPPVGKGGGGEICVCEITVFAPGCGRKREDGWTELVVAGGVVAGAGLGGGLLHGRSEDERMWWGQEY